MPAAETEQTGVEAASRVWVVGQHTTRQWDDGQTRTSTDGATKTA